MLSFHARIGRSALRSFAAVLFAIPLVAGECTDLTSTSSSSSSTSYDGTYTLLSVDGQGLPYNIIYVNSQNRLSLTRGEWTISGSSLTTRMWTTSYVNGVAQSEARFNPEVHTCTISVSGDQASCTLDSGTPIYATISGGTVVYDYSGHQLKFQK
jgi:hypothetical protein